MLTDAQIAAEERRLAERESAAKQAFPGPLAPAFCGPAIVACGLTFRPVELGDAITLEQIGSPMAKILDALGADGAQHDKFSLAQVRDMVFLWTQDAEVAAQFADRGPDAWRKEVRQWTRRTRLPLSGIPQLLDAIRRNLERGFATAVGYGPAVADDGAGGDFTAPPPLPTTGSAGG